MPSRIARAARWLDGLLGRFVFRAVGVVLAVLTLGAGRAALSAVDSGQQAATALLVPVAAVLAVATAYCFSPKRRLSQIED